MQLFSRRRTVIYFLLETNNLHTCLICVLMTIANIDPGVGPSKQSRDSIVSAGTEANVASEITPVIR